MRSWLVKMWPQTVSFLRISAPWFMPRVWTNACEKGESVTGRGATLACRRAIRAKMLWNGLFRLILICFDRFFLWPPSPKLYPQRNCQTATHRNTLASVTKFRKKRRGIELLLWPKSSWSWPVSDDAAARTIASLIIKYLWRLSFILPPPPPLFDNLVLFSGKHLRKVVIIYN